MDLLRHVSIDTYKKVHRYIDRPFVFLSIGVYCTIVIGITCIAGIMSIHTGVEIPSQHEIVKNFKQGVEKTEGQDLTDLTYELLLRKDVSFVKVEKRQKPSLFEPAKFDISVNRSTGEQHIYRFYDDGRYLVKVGFFRLGDSPKGIIQLTSEDPLMVLLAMHFLVLALVVGIGYIEQTVKMKIEEYQELPVKRYGPLRRVS